MADAEQQLNEGEERRQSGVYDTYVLPTLAEFVGVCFYALIAVLLFSGYSIGPIYVGFGEGLAVAAFMFIFSRISGGHLNPAVTLGATIAGKITAVNIVLAVLYFIAQVLGGMLGVAFARAVVQNDMFTKMNGGLPIFYPNVNVGWRILGEFLMTSGWVFIYLMTFMNGQANGKKVAPFAVGLYVIIGRCASFSSTGGSMNPALSFGKSVVSCALIDGAWTDHYVFWVGPLVGAFVTGIVYRLFFAPSDKRWLYNSGGSQHVSF